MQSYAAREADESATAEVTVEALDPLVGQTVDGRFRIVDVIGKGAMGTVYRAVQSPLNRAVALKILDSRSGAGRDETFKQRFLVEAALTAKLNHPNTVRVLDYGHTPDGLFFLAMEYLDGDTLETVLTYGPLPWRRVVNIGQQMARALREAHELGVVHRDLKPANVVLLHADDDADFVKVLDFGLVKSFVEGQELEGRAITKKGMLMGSPQYMAPEQGEQNRADPRSDIYSLGTMLFEMLTGKPPFTGQGTLDVILKHVHQPVPQLQGPMHLEPVPDELREVVLKCLAKSPMDRFQSVDELLVALQDLPAPPRAITQEFSTTDAVANEHGAAFAAQATNLGPKALAGAFLVAMAIGILVTWALMRSPWPSRLVVHLESKPSGATVMVEGKTLGVTPIDLQRGLGAEGRASFQVRLEKAGFAPLETTVNGLAGRIELSTTLYPLPPSEEAYLVAPAASPPEPEPGRKKKGPGRKSTEVREELKRPTLR